MRAKTLDQKENEMSDKYVPVTGGCLCEAMRYEAEAYS